MALDKKFKKYAEKVVSDLKPQRAEKVEEGACLGSCLDLYVAKNANVAIIGIQTTYQVGDPRGIYKNTTGCEDKIYLLEGNQNPKKVLEQMFVAGGRMYPTEIADDGTNFKYTWRRDFGGRKLNQEYDIATGESTEIRE